MPELPEVETIRRQLDPVLRAREVVDVWAFPHPKFTPALLLLGAELRGVDRRGKYLLVRAEAADGPSDLVVHLGMTGSLRVRPADESPDPYDRARWRFDDGEVLAYRDVRRFGRLAVVPRGAAPPGGTLERQGPEPWDPSLDDGGLWRALRRSDRRVKTQLLSQLPLAGVGNIYADEALWAARIHPARRAVTRRQADELLTAIRAVLEDGIRHGGTTLRDYVDATGSTGENQHHLRCYGRAGEPCERCGTLLERVVLDARSTTFCPTCQPPPRPRRAGSGRRR
jgi:formamidopyrimidine-DNA glycosylase